jgi:hypothetical protein
MKLVLAVWVLAPAALVSGCSPATSIRPLYTEEDLKKPVVEPRIEGEWISPNTEEPEKAGTDEELWLRWKIAPPEKAGETYSTYTVEFRPAKPDSGKEEEVSSYNVRLVPIGDKLFFDADFRNGSQGNHAVGRSDFLGLTPAHVVGRMWVQQDFLRVALLEGDWVKDNSPETFREIVNYSKYSDDVTITGSTKELREFLVRNADNEKALADVVYLCRPGTDCATRAAEDALARSPDADQVLEKASQFFFARHNYARAATLRWHRVELDPMDITRHSDLSDTLLCSRDFAGARRELAQVQELALRGNAKPPDYNAQSIYARANEDVVWSYFLEGKYADAVSAAVNATKSCKPGEKPCSVSPILLSYFSLLRLGRREVAESLLKDESARFRGSAEEHALLLNAEGRVSESFPYSDSKSEELQRYSFFGGLRDVAIGRPDTAKVHLGFAASEDSTSVIALAARIELERLDPKAKK